MSDQREIDRLKLEAGSAFARLRGLADSDDQASKAPLPEALAAAVHAFLSLYRAREWRDGGQRRSPETRLNALCRRFLTLNDGGVVTLQALTEVFAAAPQTPGPRSPACGR